MNDGAGCAAWLEGLRLNGFKGPLDAAQFPLEGCGLPRSYRAHELIFREGELPTRLHFVLSGSVKVFKSGLHKHEQILRIAGAGELIGYRSLFAREVYSASAEAREPTVLCSLERKDFEELVRKHPEFSLGLIQNLSRELGALREDLLSRRDASAEERLLLCIKRHVARPGEAPIAPLKRVELANLIGVTPETVSRLLGRLAEKQVLRLEGGGIELINA